MALSRFREDPRYWKPFEVVEACFHHCVGYVDTAKSFIFHFGFPAPGELSDIIDALNYYQFAYIREVDADLFHASAASETIITIRKEEIQKRLFEVYRSKSCPASRFSKPPIRPIETYSGCPRGWKLGDPIEDDQFADYPF